MELNEPQWVQKPVERVGVLMIHGIGQQARYGYLEPEVSEIARALSEHAAKNGLRPPVIRARSRAPKLRGATNASWNDGKGAPIVIELDLKEKLLELHFREVWWADLGDRPGWKSLTYFYAWALGMWLRPEARAITLGGQARMRFPERAPPTWTSKLLYRGYLALVGLVVFLPIPLSLSLRMLRVGAPRFARLLAEYLGDVKLYQDQERSGDVRIEDLGLPPRVSIRARMVHALVEMALSKYDRWYICAHSLGSVIAFNGLMETEQALPNYLDDATLARAQAEDLLTETDDPARVLNEGEQKRMCPPRQAVLGERRIIDRNRLFAGLRGMLTYGCPLERFRLLWPTIVPINREAAPARAAFSQMTWFNVHDPSDPVSQELKSFAPANKESHPEPINIAYSCRRPHLFAHISYLKFRKGPCAARSLGEWLVRQPLSEHEQDLGQQKDIWSAVKLTTSAALTRNLLELFGWAIALVLGAALTTVVVLLLAYLFTDLGDWSALYAPKTFAYSVLLVLLAGVGLMLPSGLMLHFVQSRADSLRHAASGGEPPDGGGPSSYPAVAPKPTA